MADCAHWYRQELFEEEIAAKDRELRAAYQRTAALEEKLRRIRELTEGVERPNVSSLYDAFEQQREQALALSANNGGWLHSVLLGLNGPIWPSQW